IQRISVDVRVGRGPPACSGAGSIFERDSYEADSCAGGACCSAVLERAFCCGGGRNGTQRDERRAAGLQAGRFPALLCSNSKSTAHRCLPEKQQGEAERRLPQSVFLIAASSAVTIHKMVQGRCFWLASGFALAMTKNGRGFGPLALGREAHR